MTGYDRDVRSGGGRPTRLTRLVETALAIVALLVLLGAAPPPGAGPDSLRQLIDAPPPAGPPGGLDGLGLVLVAGLAIGVLALLAGAVILFRTRGAKAVPPTSEGWWTCPNCGAGNMDGAARCHACSTWRTTTPRSTTSASP